MVKQIKIKTYYLETISYKNLFIVQTDFLNKPIIQKGNLNSI